MEPAIFHPYKLIHESRSSLQLQAHSGSKVAVFAFRIIPIVMLITGVIMFVTQDNLLFLLIFGGIAFFEALLFSFIKIPAALSMDSMGFTLELLSIKGKEEVYFLWSDVDFIKYKTVNAKNSTSLMYEAVLKTGKKRSFLNFPNYHSKKNDISLINEVLREISRKDIQAK